MDRLWTGRTKGLFLGVEFFYGQEEPRDFFLRGIFMDRLKMSKIPGVRFREHPTRKHGLRADQYFTIYYRHNGRNYEEGVGWASEGWTPSKVRDLLAELKANQRRGEEPFTLKDKRDFAIHAQAQRASENISFADFFTNFYLPFAKTTKGKTTWEKEEQHARLHLIPSFGKVPIKNIAVTPHLEKLVASMTDYSKRSIQYTLGTFERTWRKAAQMALTSGQVPKIKIGKIDNERQSYLTPEQGNALINILVAREEQRAADFAAILLDTGMRPSEVFALTWDRVNLEEGVITVIRTKGKQDRFIPLTDRLRGVFERIYAQRSPKQRLVYATGKGTPLRWSPGSIQTALDELIPGNIGREPKTRLTVYSLRHSFGSNHLASGTNPFLVQKLMGHSTPVLTARYSHAALEQLQDAQRGLERYSQKRNEKIKFLKTSRRAAQ